MEKTEKHIFFSQNSLFGAIMGLSFVITSWVFITTGKPIASNPSLNNILMLLTIVGTFIGVRKYREDALGGAITYGHALGTCTYIVSIASLLYGIYTIILYQALPHLQDQYLETLDAALREVYSDSPMVDSLSDMMKTFTTSYSIGFSEIFSRIFSGFIFSLFLAGILRKKAPEQQL